MPRSLAQERKRSVNDETTLPRFTAGGPIIDQQEIGPSPFSERGRLRLAGPSAGGNSRRAIKGALVRPFGWRGHPSANHLGRACLGQFFGYRRSVIGSSTV